MKNININRIIELRKELDELNQTDLADINFYKDEQLINISQEIIDNWRFIGLNNVDFVLIHFVEENHENKTIN